MATVTRVILAAPTSLARAGLRAMLASSGTENTQIVGEIGMLDGGVMGLSEAEVVVVSGEDLLDNVAAELSGDGTLSLILVSDENRSVEKLRGLPLKGWGIVGPDASGDELGAAVSAVARGLIVLPATMVSPLFGEGAPIEALSEPLTAREHQVLGLIGRGLSNKQIAGELFISEHTVKFHISSLYEKLGVNNRAEAVSQGARRGLISL